MISPVLSNPSNKLALLGKQPLLKHTETAQHSNKPHSTGQPGIKEHCRDLLCLIDCLSHTALEHLLETGLDQTQHRSDTEGEEMLGLWLHRHCLVQKSQQDSRSVTATALAAPPFHLLRQQIPRQTLMQSTNDVKRVLGSKQDLERGRGISRILV